MKQNINTIEILKGLLILVVIVILVKFNSLDLNIATKRNNTITISGKAEKEVSPDTARISFSITEYDLNGKIAADIVNSKTKQIIDFVKDLGVEEENIKTTNYSVKPQYY
jgi:uncharacterized protein YggE